MSGGISRGQVDELYTSASLPQAVGNYPTHKVNCQALARAILTIKPVVVKKALKSSPGRHTYLNLGAKVCRFHAARCGLAGESTRDRLEITSARDRSVDTPRANCCGVSLGGNRRTSGISAWQTTSPALSSSVTNIRKRSGQTGMPVREATPYTTWHPIITMQARMAQWGPLILTHDSALPQQGTRNS